MFEDSLSHAVDTNNPNTTIFRLQSRHIAKRQQGRDTQRRIARARRRRGIEGQAVELKVDAKLRQFTRIGDGLIVTTGVSPYYEPHDNSDRLATVKRKKYYPEETYEHWHLEKELNKNVQRHVILHRKKDNKDIKRDDEDGVIESSSDDEQYLSDEEERKAQDGNDDDDGDGDDNDDEEEEEDRTVKDKFIEQKVKDQTPFIDKVSTRLIVQRNGYEVLSFTVSKATFLESHVRLLARTAPHTSRQYQNLCNLLHLCVLRRKWELGYKVFSTLIRLPQMDIRAIWPQGLEILTRLAEQKYQEESAEDVSNYTLRTFASNTGVAMKLVKDEEFLQWMVTFYPITMSRENLTWTKPFPYRKGSRLTAPIFVVTLIWTMLYKQKFDAVNEKLSDLLLTSPFINDGVFHFIQGLSYQLEAAFLSQRSQESTRSNNKLKIEQLIKDAEKFYQQAKVLGTVIPEKLIKVELDLIKSNIEQEVHNDTSDNQESDIDIDMMINGATETRLDDTNEFGYRENGDDPFNRLRDTHQYDLYDSDD